MPVTLKVKSLNVKPVLKEINALRRGQSRKVLASAITDTLFAVRKAAVGTWWGQSVKVRNQRFLSASLRVSRGRSATLKGMIEDKLKRAALSWNVAGGSRAGFGGFRAVPTPLVHNSRTGSGKVKASLRPTVKGIFLRDNSLYKKFGRGKRATIKRLYSLARRVSQPKTFDFYGRAGRLAKREFPTFLSRRIEQKLAQLRPRS